MLRKSLAVCARGKGNVIGQKNYFCHYFATVMVVCPRRDVRVYVCVRVRRGLNDASSW